MHSLICLNGIWSIELDNKRYEASVPGCWDALIDSKAIAGPVWYKKTITVPRLSDYNNRWILKFDAVSYYCEVFVNGIHVRNHEGMWDNFYFDVTDMIDRRMENNIELKIFKQGYDTEDKFKFREVLSGFIPDVGCTFGGIWGNVSLEEKPHVFIEKLHVEADINNKSAKAHLKVVNTSSESVSIEAKVFIKDKNKLLRTVSKRVIAEAKQCNKYEIEVGMDEVILWDIENPYLYDIELSLLTGEKEIDKSKKRFGMREIKAEGEKILLNGRPVYLRGILHWGYYPEIIHANPEKEAIKHEILKAKEMGFNTIKHCLYIPREDYYELADEMGMLLWQELPLWLPEVTPQLKERMSFEYPRIIEQLAGHPSLVMYSLGCELDSSIDAGILEEMYHMAKTYSGNLLVRDNSGSGECYGGLTVDFADFYDYHFYADLHNMENLIETFTPQWRERRPWIFGEFCDIDTYRDLRELKKKHSEKELWWSIGDKIKNPISDVKPDFFIHMQEERLKDNGLAEDTELLKELSIKHGMLHRKYTLELTRQFPEICGYNITAIRDVPIATSGIFDDNMELKFNPKEFKAFNDDIVLSPAWDLRRTWVNGDRVLNKDKFNYWSGDNFGMHVVVSNYSSKSLVNPVVEWKLLNDEGTIFESREELNKTVKIGAVEELIVLRAKLPEIDKACGIWVYISLICGDALVENKWRIWVYPKERKDISQDNILLFDTLGILQPLKKLYNLKQIDDWSEVKGQAVLTTRITPAIEKYLIEGGKVFYIQRGDGYLPHVKCSFWRESFCRYFEHDILKEMPRDDYMDLQYFGLGTDTAIDTFNIKNKYISDIKPVIRRIDARQYLASDYMVEMKAGNGTLVATTLRFEGGMGKQPNSIEYNNAALFLIDQVLEHFNNI